MTFFFICVTIIFLNGLLALFLPEKVKIRVFSIILGAGSAGLFVISIRQLINPEIISTTLTLNRFFGPISMAMDPLSAFFTLVISVMGSLGAFYAIGYLKPYLFQNRPTGAHLFFYGNLMVFMLLTVTAQNALAFLIAWELMSLSSFFLIVFENEKKEIMEAGISYLVWMHIGFLALLAGFVLLWIKSGSLDFTSFSAVLRAGAPLSVPVFILFSIGFGMKAGFIPLHTWLPLAHPAAPSPVSGIMSGVMIKMGIYGILRTIAVMGRPGIALSYFVIAVSLVSGLLGVMYAIAQHDLKRLLAFHSVENIGIIGLGIGTGMLGMACGIPAMTVLGFAGAILHVLNHSLFKTLLFFGAGAVYTATHTRNLEKLGGLVRTMPFTSLFFLAGSMAISGLPPFNGFISELLIYMGMFRGLASSQSGPVLWSVTGIACLAFIGAMAAVCFTKVFGVVFLGNPRKQITTHEVEPSMLFPMGILSAACLLIGLFPQWIIALIRGPVLSVAGTDPAASGLDSVLAVPGKISFFLFGLIGFSLVLVLARQALLRRRIKRSNVWACGYQAGNPRMQYTASSFSRGFLVLVKPLIGYKVLDEDPEGAFPSKGRVETHIKDMVEARIVGPFLHLIHRFFSFFQWIQSGNTQDYILYGLVFLIFVLLAVMGIG